MELPLGHGPHSSTHGQCRWRGRESTQQGQGLEKTTEPQEVSGRRFVHRVEQSAEIEQLIPWLERLAVEGISEEEEQQGDESETDESVGGYNVTTFTTTALNEQKRK